MSKETIYYQELSDKEMRTPGINEWEDLIMTRQYDELPTDKKGYVKGKFRVSVVWCSEDDCDCTGFQHHQDCPHWEMSY